MSQSLLLVGGVANSGWKKSSELYSGGIFIPKSIPTLPSKQSINMNGAFMLQPLFTSNAWISGTGILVFRRTREIALNSQFIMVFRASSSEPDLLEEAFGVAPPIGFDLQIRQFEHVVVAKANIRK
ncbi:uncharacterized protein PAC_19021 [Phialocephala subalpina]|uniref:Uncharacterized protein n=1 Tax=Phialocephala subalpina TaxID=576137 RepID=A0A1L7XVR1_9HELO|nr:uncharacterized protein PAC_19021 [Phialocephala subalpina]